MFDYASTNGINFFHLQSLTEIRLVFIRQRQQVDLEHNLVDLAQNLRNLEKIKIKCQIAVSFATIKQVVQHAIKLSEFHETGRFRIAFYDHYYNQMLNIVQARTDDTKLSITFKSMIPLNNRVKKLSIWDNHRSLTIFNFGIQKYLEEVNAF